MSYRTASTRYIIEVGSRFECRWHPPFACVKQSDQGRQLCTEHARWAPSHLYAAEDLVRCWISQYIVHLFRGGVHFGTQDEVEQKACGLRYDDFLVCPAPARSALIRCAGSKSGTWTAQCRHVVKDLAPEVGCRPGMSGMLRWQAHKRKMEDVPALRARSAAVTTLIC